MRYAICVGGPLDGRCVELDGSHLETIDPDSFPSLYGAMTEPFARTITYVPRLFSSRATGDVLLLVPRGTEVSIDDAKRVIAARRKE